MQDNYERQIKELREMNQILEEKTDFLKEENGLFVKEIDLLKKLVVQLKNESYFIKKKLTEKNKGTNSDEDFFVIGS
jgi:hypothetical protein